MREQTHVAIIMDGNGRWATRRGMPRTAGHAQGAKAVDAVVEAAARPESGIGWLTLYAFSSDNWARPAREVRSLMRLFGRYLEKEVPRCVANGIRLEVVGRRDRLAAALVRRIEEAERRTMAGAVAPKLTLRLAIDYSARDRILAAVAAVAAAGELRQAARTPGDGAGAPSPREAVAALDAESFGRLLSGSAPDVDLLIRTGGEQRLSDFLLWESAYAELYFTPTLWPDFDAAELARALAEFGRRDRRFGRILDEAV
jgi:undecaprenyl diphosphate synthase